MDNKGLFWVQRLLEIIWFPTDNLLALYNQRSFTQSVILAKYLKCMYKCLFPSKNIGSQKAAIISRFIIMFKKIWKEYLAQGKSLGEVGGP